jgi:hypothetical protein
MEVVSGKNSYRSAMSQELITGLVAAFASDIFNDPESACVSTDQLLAYA